MSVTSSPILAINRPLGATIAGASVTSAAQLAILRGLAATIAGGTLTSSASLTVENLIALAASILGQSLTSSPILAVTRPLSATIAGASLISDPILAVLRPLAATISGGSVTPAPALAILRSLAGTIAGGSLTSSPILAVLRALAATIAGASQTSNASLTLQGIIELAASIIGASATSTPILAVNRLLGATIAGASQTNEILAATLSPAATAVHLSTVAAATFVFIDGVDLADHRDGRHRAIFTDSTGKTATAWIKAETPGGETLGSELYPNGDMEQANPHLSYGSERGSDATEIVKKHSGSQSVRFTVTPGQTNGYWSAGDSPALEVGALYRVGVWGYNESTTAMRPQLGSGGGNESQLPYIYAVGVWTETYRWITKHLQTQTLYSYFDGDGATGYFDDITFKQVTDPPSTGVLLVSTLGGETRNFESIETGFNPNAVTQVRLYKEVPQFAVLRPLAGAMLGTSLTSTAAMTVENLIALAASILGQSATSSAVLAVARDLAASVLGESAGASPVLSVLRELSAAIEGASRTENAALMVAGDGTIVFVGKKPRVHFGKPTTG